MVVEKHPALWAAGVHYSKPSVLHPLSTKVEKVENTSIFIVFTMDAR